MDPELKALAGAAETLFLRPWLGETAWSGAFRKALEAAAAGKLPYPRGVALSALGDYAGAFAALSEAVETLPGRAGPRVARAELALRRGLTEVARVDLAAAAMAEPKNPWPRVLNAWLLWKEGDVAGAAALAGGVSRQASHCAAGPVMRALIDAQSGKRDQALSYLKKALSRTSASWLRALSARLKTQWGDLPGACRDLAGIPSARLERARLLYRLERHDEALRELARAARDYPRDHYIPLLSAEIHAARDRFDLAARDCAKALSLNPKDHWPLVRRSHAWLSLGRLDAARRDLEVACALAPQDDALRHRLFQALALCGDEEGLKQALRRPGLAGPLRDYWTACLLLRQGRCAEAAGLFASCADADTELARRASLFTWAARALESEAPIAAPGLVLIGLGYRKVHETSIAALRALRGAEALYVVCNTLDEPVKDLLALFPGKVRPIVFRGTEAEVSVAVRQVFAGFKTGKRLAMVTRGHPIVYGLLATRLVEAARRRRVSCRVVGAVSTFDELPALAGAGACSRGGLQVRGAFSLEGLDAALPLVVYAPQAARGRKALASLRSRYPASHPCFLLPSAGPRALTALSAPLSEVLGRAVRDPEPLVLLVPAKVATGGRC